VVTNRAKVLQRLKDNEDDLLIMGPIPSLTMNWWWSRHRIIRCRSRRR